MPHPVQADLFGAPPGQPEGLAYRPGFLTPAEHDALLARVARVEVRPFRFQGFTGKRRVASFGRRYDFEGGGLQPAEPVPEWLRPFSDRAAALAATAPQSIAHVLLTEYAPGAGIGWHRDRPEFGDVVGISLGAPCVLRFRRREGDGWRRFALTVEPGSAYLLSGPARWDWQHGIAAVDAPRWSLTFRSLR